MAEHPEISLIHLEEAERLRSRWREENSPLLDEPMGSDKYDRQGRPIDTALWMILWSDFDYKVVKKTVVGFCEVSTVWLGSDHSFGLGGPPLLFETMIFGGPLDQSWCERCDTEDRALEMHERGIEAALRVGPKVRGLFRWIKRLGQAEYPELVIEEFKVSWLRDRGKAFRSHRARLFRGMRAFVEGERERRTDSEDPG